MIRFVLVAALAVAACTDDQPDSASRSGDPPTGTSIREAVTEPAGSEDGRPEPGPVPRLAARIDEIDDAVRRWATADDLEPAQQAARRAAALVSGPDGPDVGDGVEVGLLPALDGEPVGLAVAAVDAGAPDCVGDDVLGGPWTDPAQRWQELDDVLSRWRPERNTMPELDSHAQRVVGWARLTAATDRLDTARTYAGHAALHVEVMRQALTSCGTG